VGPRAGLDAVAWRKIFHPLPGLESPSIQPVAQRYTTVPNIGETLLFSSLLFSSLLFSSLLFSREPRPFTTYQTE
jgi:hypothetical protein